MAKISRIIVHCSDTPDSRDDIDVKTIREWHVRDRGWKDIGYHYVVCRDGTMQAGRKENGDQFLTGDEIGAHTKGHNHDSLSICWVGRNRMSVEQEKAFYYWLVVLARVHKLHASDIYGHYEFDAGKTCPNLDMNQVRQKVEDRLEMAYP